VDGDVETSGLEIGYPPCAVEEAESRRVMNVSALVTVPEVTLILFAHRT
jgi:hypothetical protein